MNVETCCFRMNSQGMYLQVIFEEIPEENEAGSQEVMCVGFREEAVVCWCCLARLPIVHLSSQLYV